MQFYAGIWKQSKDYFLKAEFSIMNFFNISQVCLNSYYWKNGYQGSDIFSTRWIRFIKIIVWNKIHWLFIIKIKKTHMYISTIYHHSKLKYVGTFKIVIPSSVESAHSYDLVFWIYYNGINNLLITKDVTRLLYYTCYRTTIS